MKNAVSSKKFWLAYHDDPAGSIRVDKGAARALLRNGKSLLPIGIAGVDGCFERGALVWITTPEGDGIGVGVHQFLVRRAVPHQGQALRRTARHTRPDPL